MEPTIYNTGIYNFNSVYKLGSIYNGNGVYKDGKYTTVKIGNKTYKAKKYGSLWWTTESLQNNVPTYTDPKPGKGYLYQWDAVEDIKLMLADGWRVPTKDDWNNLIGLLGTPGGPWIAVDDGGTNKNEFNLFLNGYVNYYGTYYDNNHGYAWSDTNYNTTNKWSFYAELDHVSADDTASFSGGDTKLQLRLCKDA